MKLTLLTTAVAFYASVVWASLRFFRVDSSGSLFGKRLISVLGGAAIMVSLAQVGYTDPPGEVRTGFATALYAIGLLLFWLAYRANRSNPLDYAFSSHEPRHLVTVGPYRFIRHPFYASYVVGWLAPLVYSVTPISVVVLCIMSVLYFRAALLEERLYCNSALATQYETYRSATYYFVPWIF